MINGGATHVGVATDHVIESFRNRLWRGYKTSAGIEPELLAQFPLLEEALRPLGVVVWPMVEFEADDALAAAAAMAARDPRVERVRHLHARQGPGAVRARHARRAAESPDATTTRDEAGVIAKFGVPPASIPDYLALVGDAADGYPGLPRLGREVDGRRARAVRPSRIDSRGLARLARERRQRRARWPRRSRASAIRRSCFAISRRCAPTSRSSTSSTSCEWRGPTPAFARLAAGLDKAARS